MFLTYSTAPKPFPIRSVYRPSNSYGKSFHWLEAGWKNQETIVLLHGLLAHSMAYRKVVPRLASQYRLIIPDLPAHGRDQTYESGILQPRIDGLLGWLEELLEAIDAERIHLVGHSLGALVTFMAARESRITRRVDSVSLVSPGIRIGVPRWLHRFFDKVPLGLARLGTNPLGIRVYEPIQWRKSRMTSSEVASYLEPLRQPERLRFIVDMGIDLIREPDRLVGAERIDRSTLIVWGEKDHLLPVETGRVLQSTIADAHFEVLEGVGHCPMEDSPDEFVNILNGFLKT